MQVWLLKSDRLQTSDWQMFDVQLPRKMHEAAFRIDKIWFYARLYYICNITDAVCTIWGGVEKNSLEFCRFSHGTEIQPEPLDSSILVLSRHLCHRPHVCTFVWEFGLVSHGATHLIKCRREGLRVIIVDRRLMGTEDSTSAYTHWLHTL